MKKLILIIMIVIPMVCFGQSDDVYFTTDKDKVQLKSFGFYEKGIHCCAGEVFVIKVDGDTKPYEKLFKPFGAEYLSKHMESLYAMWLEHLSECEGLVKDGLGCMKDGFCCTNFIGWVYKEIDVLKELHNMKKLKN